MILHLEYRCIITLDSKIPPNIQQYMITIGTFPDCSCPYFKEMVTKALSKQGQWANCKHLYFIFNTELAIHVLGQVHCSTTILEPKLGFVKILPPSIFSHECSPNCNSSYIAYVLPFHRWATQSYTQ
jgi:hypothetical protein